MSRAAVPSISASHTEGSLTHVFLTATVHGMSLGEAGKGGKQVPGDRSIQHTPGLPKPLGTCPSRGKQSGLSASFCIGPLVNEPLPVTRESRISTEWTQANPQVHAVLYHLHPGPPYLFPGFLLT